MWKDDNNHILFAGKGELPHFCPPCFGPLPTAPDSGNHRRAPALRPLGTFEEKKEKSF